MFRSTLTSCTHGGDGWREATCLNTCHVLITYKLNKNLLSANQAPTKFKSCFHHGGRFQTGWQVIQIQKYPLVIKYVIKCISSHLSYLVFLWLKLFGLLQFHLISYMQRWNFNCSLVDYQRVKTGFVYWGVVVFFFFLISSFLYIHVQVVDTRKSYGNGARSLHTQPHYSGIKNVIGSVYKEGGVRGLYRGVGIYTFPLLFFLKSILCG